MPAKIDLTGKIFGKLTVKAEADRAWRTKIHWLCLCECGNEVEVAGSNLQAGSSTTCGCSQAPEDLSGKVFGMWSVIGLAKNPTRATVIMWDCTCKCGTTRPVEASSLRRGKSTSCGCVHTRHGLTHTSTYKIWLSMVQRVTNPKSKSYHNYGGRGLTIDPSWLTFEGFYKDMGERPAGLSIERKNNNLGYSKENCIWADTATQSRNKRSNIWVLYKGQKITLADVALQEGKAYVWLYHRVIAKGRPISEVLGSEDYQLLGKEVL